MCGTTAQFCRTAPIAETRRRFSLYASNLDRLTCGRKLEVGSWTTTTPSGSDDLTDVEKSRFHALRRKKAKKKRKVARTPDSVNPPSCAPPRFVKCSLTKELG